MCSMSSLLIREFATKMTMQALYNYRLIVATDAKMLCNLSLFPHVNMRQDFLYIISALATVKSSHLALLDRIRYLDN